MNIVHVVLELLLIPDVVVLDSSVGSSEGHSE